MPRISDIKRQKRNSDRFSLYVDGVYSFSLSDLALSNSGLRVGQSLGAPEVEQWQAQALEAKAYNAALGQLSYRRRSHKELVDYLSRKDFDQDVIEAVLIRLTGVGLADDIAFAAAWINDRQLLKPRSTRVLFGELRQKGIATDVINDALTVIDEPTELAALCDLIERKRRQSSYNDSAKIMGYVARQGYSYDRIKKALARLDGSD